jgi:hypothetical protein
MAIAEIPVGSRRGRGAFKMNRGANCRARGYGKPTVLSFHSGAVLWLRIGVRRMRNLERPRRRDPTGGGWGGAVVVLVIRKDITSVTGPRMFARRNNLDLTSTTDSPNGSPWNVRRCLASDFAARCANPLQVVRIPNYDD